MNSARAGRVLVATAWASLLLPLLAGCDAADGGAVDLSWTIRTTQALDIDCAEAGVEWVRLTWQVDGVTGSRRWRCNLSRAITDFEVPPGTALLSVEPVCAGTTADPASFETPAPVARVIETGEAISLGAVVISVQVDDCDEQPCFCS